MSRFSNSDEADFERSRPWRTASSVSCRPRCSKDVSVFHQVSAAFNTGQSANYKGIGIDIELAFLRHLVSGSRPRVLL